MFHCRECNVRWALAWREGETEAEYAERLQTTTEAACPRCGTLRPRCQVRIRERFKTMRRETE